MELVRSGVWSRPARLAMDQSARVPGQEWARRVRECGPDEEAEFVATDVASLLAGSGCDRISILKMDVEGAEAQIFSKVQD